MVFVLAGLISLLGVPGSASACSCIGGSSVSDRIVRADAVFHGRVVETLDLTPEDPEKLHTAYQYVTLEVLQSWKGVPENAEEVTFYQETSSSVCGDYREVGDEAIYFAERTEPHPSDSSIDGQDFCSLSSGFCAGNLEPTEKSIREVEEAIAAEDLETAMTSSFLECNGPSRPIVETGGCTMGRLNPSVGGISWYFLLGVVSLLVGVRKKNVIVSSCE